MYAPMIAVRQANGTWRFEPAAPVETLPFTAVEMVPLGERHSWAARQRLFSMAWAALDATYTRDPELTAVGEWWMNRARRQFREALWADEASVS